MKKPRLLDLFCCAGGAGMGYARAGFDVVGVDINPQPRIETREEAERTAKIANIAYSIGYNNALADIRKALGIFE